VVKRKEADRSTRQIGGGGHGKLECEQAWLSLE